MLSINSLKNFVFLAFRITPARVNKGRDHLSTLYSLLCSENCLQNIFSSCPAESSPFIKYCWARLRWSPASPARPSKLLFPLEEMTSNNLEGRPVVKITTFLLLRSIQHRYIFIRKFKPKVKPFILFLSFSEKCLEFCF